MIIAVLLACFACLVCFYNLASRTELPEFILHSECDALVLLRVFYIMCNLTYSVKLMVRFATVATKLASQMSAVCAQG